MPRRADPLAAAWRSPGRSDRSTWRARLGVGVVVIACLALGLAAVRYAAPVGPVRVALGQDGLDQVRASGACCAIRSWPAAEQSAVSVPLVGYEQSSGSETPVPIASTTKIMTAYVVLHDHPLAPGASGPLIRITATDVSILNNDDWKDESSVPVYRGELLTEYQMLQEMLVRSANNLATALAVWDAGTATAFVAEMNREAAALGMTHTHYADASGFDPASVSTASDLLVVAARAMAVPVFAQIVDQPTVDVPTAGILPSYTPLVGTAGVTGVKSGFTAQAGPCDVLALQGSVAGRRVTVLAAVLGSKTEDTDLAGGQALALARSVLPDITLRTVATRGQRAGVAELWGDDVPVVVARSVQVLAMADEDVVTSLAGTRSGIAVGDRRGTVCGYLRVALGTQVVSVALVSTGPIRPPGAWQRITR